MLSEVNKVNKDNPIFISFLLYFVPTPCAYFDSPPFNNFSKSLKTPPFILTPPIYYEPESTKYKPQVGHSQGVSGITEMGIEAGEGFGPLSRFKIIKV